MFENPRRDRQARNFTTNVPKILDLKSSSEQIFPKIDVGCPWNSQGKEVKINCSYTFNTDVIHDNLFPTLHMLNS